MVWRAFWILPTLLLHYTRLWKYIHKADKYADFPVKLIAASIPPRAMTFHMRVFTHIKRSKKRWNGKIDASDVVYNVYGVGTSPCKNHYHICAPVVCFFTAMDSAEFSINRRARLWLMLAYTTNHTYQPHIRGDTTVINTYCLCLFVWVVNICAVVVTAFTCPFTYNICVNVFSFKVFYNVAKFCVGNFVRE